MQKPLLGQKIAVLVANGFNEKDLTVSQKALLSAGADVRIVSMDNGLVNSWNEQGWGLNFAADQALNEALAVDFTMMIVPGGSRSVEKLKLTAHTKRFLNGFMNAKKPVALLGDAVSLLAFSGRGEGLSITGSESVRADAEAAGAKWSEETYEVSDNLITGDSSEQSRMGYVEAMVEFFANFAAQEDLEAA